jgi:1,4-alpha-glucan branching enzyme
MLRDNALMWLHEYRVDGLRWDATAYIRNVNGNDNEPANDLPDGWS